MFAQIGALEVLQDDRQDLVGDDEVADADHAGVVDGVEDLGLGEEALDDLGLAAQLLAQDLDGDGLTGDPVDSAPHDADRAARDLGLEDEAIGQDGFHDASSGWRWGPSPFHCMLDVRPGQGGGRSVARSRDTRLRAARAGCIARKSVPTSPFTRP
ncbi:hypothetical protein GCM10029992_66060 [Glycomyces albus]